MLLGTCGADVPGEWFSVIFRIFCAFWLLQTSCHVLYVFYEVCGSSTGRNSGLSTYFYAPDASESQLTYFLRICGIKHIYPLLSTDLATLASVDGTECCY